MSFNGRSITAFCHDYETTGLDVAKLGVVQAALCFAVIEQDGSYKILEQDVQNLNPGEPISAEASQIHGLTDFDVMDCPKWFEHMQEEMKTVNEWGPDAVVSFNGDRFDNRIAMRCGWTAVPSIDLFKFASIAKKEHGWEKGNLGYSYEKLIGKPLDKAHNALADIIGTLDMLKPMIELSGTGSLDEFHKLILGINGTAEMKLSFGKHKGKKLKHVPADYLDWLLSDQCDMDFSFEMQKGISHALAGGL